MPTGHNQNLKIDFSIIRQKRRFLGAADSTINKKSFLHDKNKNSLNDMEPGNINSRNVHKGLMQI